jgi:hypothetical protein
MKLPLCMPLLDMGCGGIVPLTTSALDGDGQLCALAPVPRGDRDPQHTLNRSLSGTQSWSGHFIEDKEPKLTQQVKVLCNLQQCLLKRNL